MRVIIVDDETPARNRLIRKLAVYPEVVVVGEAANGIEALEKIEILNPEIVFLDIEMPELGGLGVAHSLGLTGPKLVFVTAYDEYAVKAFEANTIDYLLKPVIDSRLKLTLEKLRNISPLRPHQLAGLPVHRVAIKSGNRYIVVDPSRVTAILARDHYAAILTDGRELLVDESLDCVASRLAGVNFLKIHRGAIINLNAVTELIHEGDRKYLAVLNDPVKTRVPVSRDKLETLKGALSF